MIVVSICLSDIDKSKITLSEKNNKKYISVVVDERKQPDNYGNSHTVYLNQSKEERTAKNAKIYIGNGKEYKFNQNNNTSGNNSIATWQPNNTIDDLPF